MAENGSFVFSYGNKNAKQFNVILKSAPFASDSIALMISDVPATIAIQTFLLKLSDSLEKFSAIQVLQNSSNNVYHLLLVPRDKKNNIESQSLLKNAINKKSLRNVQLYFISEILLDSIAYRLTKEPLPLMSSEKNDQPSKCPICLETLIPDGRNCLFSALCGHRLHLDCLSGIDAPSCPICRGDLHPSDFYVTCESCSSPCNLWMCLICGSVNCSVEKNAPHTPRNDQNDQSNLVLPEEIDFKSHAEEHFKETAHSFAQNIKSRSVWDYCEKEFASRLLAADGGKVVRFSRNRKEREIEMNEEKIDSKIKEFNVVADQQRNAMQKSHSDELFRLEKAEKSKLKKMNKKTQNLTELNRNLDAENREVEAKLSKKISLKDEMTRKLEKLKGKLEVLKKLQRALLEKQKGIKCKFEECETKRIDKNSLIQKKKNLRELKEELNDLRSHFKLQQRIKSAGGDFKNGYIFTTTKNTKH